MREDRQARDTEREPHVIERTLWSLSHHVSKPFLYLDVSCGLRCADREFMSYVSFVIK